MDGEHVEKAQWSDEEYKDMAMQIAEFLGINPEQHMLDDSLMVQSWLSREISFLKSCSKSSYVREIFTKNIVDALNDLEEVLYIKNSGDLLKYTNHPAEAVRGVAAWRLANMR